MIQYLYGTQKIKKVGFSDALAVVPDDANDLSKGPSLGLLLGVAGDIAVTTTDGTDITITGLSAGVVHPLSVKRIKSTGTTATGIVALY